MITDYLNTGMSYFHLGLAFIREWVGKIISFTGFSGELGTLILMLAVSVILGRFIAKRFVTKPFSSGMYFIPTIVISLLIFIILMYL